jgi:hypothetical protein
MSEEKRDIIRRIPLEQFGYIDVPISIDLSKTPEEIYMEASDIEHGLDAYKQAFWDMIHEKKIERESQSAAETEANEAKRIEAHKKAVEDIVKNEPDAVKAKKAEFGDMIDDMGAAALIYKEREMAKEPEEHTTAQATLVAPKFPESMKFFQQKFGWSLYTDESAVEPILKWVLSVPMADRGRKTANPKASDKGNAIWNLNDKEKAFITDEAKRQGTVVQVELKKEEK